MRDSGSGSGKWKWEAMWRIGEVGWEVEREVGKLGMEAGLEVKRNGKKLERDGPTKPLLNISLSMAMKGSFFTCQYSNEAT